MIRRSITEKLAADSTVVGFVAVLGFPLGPKTGHVYLNALESQLLLLLLQRLEQLLLRSRSFRSSSSAGIGSPEQVWGWALCAGRPGPFLVCSFLRHLARRFWNHTCFLKRKKENKMHPLVLGLTLKLITAYRKLTATRDSLRSSLIARASLMKTSG